MTTEERWLVMDKDWIPTECGEQNRLFKANDLKLDPLINEIRAILTTRKILEDDHRRQMIDRVEKLQTIFLIGLSGIPLEVCYSDTHTRCVPCRVTLPNPGASKWETPPRAPLRSISSTSDLLVRAAVSGSWSYLLFHSGVST